MILKNLSIKINISKDIEESKKILRVFLSFMKYILLRIILSIIGILLIISIENTKNWFLY